MRSKRVMSHAEPSGRVALLAGLSAAFIAVSFGYLHRMVFLDWPDIALDGPGPMLAYFAAGTVFQFGIPILCLAAFIFGASARARMCRCRIRGLRALRSRLSGHDPLAAGERSAKRLTTGYLSELRLSASAIRPIYIT